jgi:hypothetical protein
MCSFSYCILECIIFDKFTSVHQFDFLIIFYKVNVDAENIKITNGMQLENKN